MNKKSEMNIRRYQISDTPTLINLFRKTVHTVCKKDYSQEQLDAWAPRMINEEKWITRFTNSFTLVAEQNQIIAGFASLEANGFIDTFFVASETQSQGVGARLFNALEEEAQKQGIRTLLSDVSLTARRFFFSKGFVIEKEYIKKIGSVTFPNAIMSKTLG